MKIKITTKNLTIRNLRVSDISKEYVDSLNKWEIVKYTEARHQSWEYKSVKKNLLLSRKNNIPFLGLFFNDEVHIGNIRLPGIDRKNKRILLGIMIFNSSYSNKGLGSEALIGISDYLFTIAKINKITADYCIKNIASKKMFKKANYKIEGLLKKNLFIENKFEDTEIVSLIKKK